MLAALVLACSAWLLADRDALPADAPGTAPTPSAGARGPLSQAVAAVGMREVAAREADRDAPIATPLAGQLPPAVLVHGALLDAAFEPIRGAAAASVRFLDPAGLQRSARAEPDGTYALPGLAAGTYQVTASAQGHGTVEATVELHPGWSRVQQDFTLPRAVALKVAVVTPAGRDLFEVLRETGAPPEARLLVVIATREPPGARLEDATGSDHGPRRERLAPGGAGVLLLEGGLPAHVSLVHHDTVLRTVRVDGGDTVTFVLSPEDVLAGLATVRVPVVAARTGLPVAGARVQLLGGCFHSGVLTDPRGIATLAQREPGWYEVLVSAPGYATWRGRIDALPGRVSDHRPVVLGEEVTVGGRVVDGDGRPVSASFLLGVVDPASGAIRQFGKERFRSAGDGSFSLGGLDRAQYVIRTEAIDAAPEGDWEGVPSVSGNVVVDTSAGSVSTVVIRLRPASRLVLRATGTGARAGAEATRFRITDDRGFEVTSGAVRGARPRALRLAAGTYGVALCDANGTVLSASLATLGSETVTLDLDARRQ